MSLNYLRKDTTRVDIYKIDKYNKKNKNDWRNFSESISPCS